MKKAELINFINEKFDELDTILIDDLQDIFEEEDESSRNEALLRALHSKDLEVNFGLPLEKVIRDLAVWTTEQIFRSGTIEELHAGRYNFEHYENIPPNTPIEHISQLTQENMKTLNKELVDNIGFILNLFSRADYFKLASFVNSYRHYGDDWDNPNVNSIESKHEDYLLLITGADKYLDNKNMK
ncbi:hypothetical protein [Psychrobacillus sp. NPDC093180]|uniref:hypothetical protein n=1 Tax=Psychrobacillus sp. NPDC093180 TaxID=3364489 RepID=UPI0038101B7B